MKVALLGFPQSGKRTLFSLLTGRSIPPGTKDVEGVDGVAPVRDSRVDTLAAIVKPRKTTYAETTFVYCPDINEGSDKREWIEAAKRCDLLCMVVRAFSSPSVYHLKGSVDADRDRASLQMEILLADLELVEKRLERIAKERRGGQTAAQVLEEKTLTRCKEAIEADKNPRDLNMEARELTSVRSLGLLTLKPVVWTYNVDESDVREKGDDSRLAIACEIEREIMSIQAADERAAYLQELGLTSSGVDRMNRAVFAALGLISFYTIGEDEVRAWAVRKGAFAPEAASKIHSDIERGFIRVEVIKYDDFVTAGSEHAVREKGKMELRGKDYIVQAGDICHFLFNV